MNSFTFNNKEYSIKKNQLGVAELVFKNTDKRVLGALEVAHAYLHSIGISVPQSSTLEVVLDRIIGCEPNTPVNKEYMYDAFIVHKSTVAEFAQMLKEYIEGNGKRAFCSEVSLFEHGNADYVDEILNKVIPQTKHLVVIVHALSDIEEYSWIRKEILTFVSVQMTKKLSGNITTIVYDDEVMINELPQVLKDYQILKRNEYKKVLSYLR